MSYNFDFGVFDVREFCMSGELYTGEDIIRAMFNHCDDDGLITVKNYRADSPEMIPSGGSQYLISWEGFNLNSQTGEYSLASWDFEKFRDFFETLKRAAELWNAEENQEPPYSEELLAALRCFGRALFRPVFSPFSNEDEAEILRNLDVLEEGAMLYERLKQSETLDDDEMATLQEYKDNLADVKLQSITRDYKAYVNNEAEKRVGSGPMAYEFLRHCQRYRKLLSIPVPDAVLSAEEQRLAFAFIIHYNSTLIRAN